MDEYNEIYFIDEDDLRNAPRDRGREHRRVGIVRRSPAAGARPMRPRPRAVIAQPATVVDAVPIETASPEKKLFANLNPGELVEIVAQILAAIMPLPGAPTAQGHAQTDVSNLITYQSALAIHAKRDEQLRTIGSLVGKLVS